MSDDFASLKISIQASLKDFSAKMGEFEKILKGSEEQTKKTGAGFGEMAAGMLTAEAAMAVLKKTADLAMDSIKGFDDDLMRTLSLSKTLGEAGSSGIQAYNKAISEKTRFSKDDLDAAAVQLDIHKLNRQEMEKLMPVIVDFATKSGRDAASTADAFGRAIEFGTTRGLRPFGIDVDKTGSQLDIFNAIVKAGQGNVKGLGEEAGKIGMGPLLIMRHEIEELQDDLGEQLLPIFQEMVKFLRDDGMPVVKGLVENFDKFLPLVKGIGEFFISYFAVTKLAAMAVAIDGVAFSVAGLNAAILANPIGAAALAATAISMGLDALVDARIAREKKLQDELNLVGIGNVSGGSGAGLREAGSSATSSGGYLPKGFLGLNTAEVDSKIVAPIKSNLSDKDRKPDKTGKKGKTAEEKGKFERDAAIDVLESQEVVAKRKIEAEKNTAVLIAKSREEDEKVFQKIRKQSEANEKKSQEEITAIDKKNAEIRQNIMEDNLLDYVALGEQMGMAMAEGFGKGAEGLGESLKAMLVTLLGFIQAKIIARSVEIMLDDVAMYNFAGFATAAAKIAVITGAFEAAKAGVNAIKFHDGGEVPAILQAGEYVMNRQAVSRYGVPAMEAINAGRAPAGGAVGGGGMSATIINTIDPGLMDRYLASSNGQKAIVNIMRAKRYEVSRVLK